MRQSSQSALRNRFTVPMICLALAGCGTQRGADVSVSSHTSAQEPPVDARNGGNATLDLTVCPPNSAHPQDTHDMLQTLENQGTLVEADGNSTARLIVNACPQVPQPEPAKKP